MRQLVIDSIKHFLDPHDKGRYGPVLQLLFKLEAGLPTMAPLSRAQSKIYAEWTAEGYHFYRLNDQQLLDINNMVQRRFAIQR